MSEGDFGLVEGSGNVFRDFGDPDADLKQAKAVLAARIIAVLDDHGLTVRKATGLSRFAAADFSRIRNANLGRFTLDGLVRMLGALDTGLQVTVRPAACRRGGHDEPRLSSGLSMLEKRFLFAMPNPENLTPTPLSGRSFTKQKLSAQGAARYAPGIRREDR